MLENGLDLEVYSDGANEGRAERIVRIAEEEGSLSNAAVPNDQQLEHVIEVLIGRILLPLGVASGRHLQVTTTTTELEPYKQHNTTHRAFLN